MCESAKIKPGLPWRLQGVGHSKAVRYLPRRVTDRMGSRPRRKKQVAVRESGRSGSHKEPSYQSFDIKNGDTEIRVSQLDFSLALSRITSL